MSETGALTFKHQGSKDNNYIRMVYKKSEKSPSEMRPWENTVAPQELPISLIFAFHREVIYF